MELAGIGLVAVAGVAFVIFMQRREDAWPAEYRAHVDRQRRRTSLRLQIGSTAVPGLAGIVALAIGHWLAASLAAVALLISLATVFYLRRLVQKDQASTGE